MLVVALLLTTIAGTSPAAPAPDLLARAPSRFARLDGIRVHYKSLGRGEAALVFVHGWSCDLTFWREQAAAFAPRSRVVALDLPGHGRSDKPEVAYTVDLFARAVQAVMRDAGVKRAALVGHSMGGLVARQACRLEPERVRALVLVDAGLRPPFSDPAEARKWAALYREPEYRHHAGRAIDGLMAEKTPAALREQIKQSMLATPQHVMASAAENMTDPALFVPQPIGVPVVAVVADAAFWRGYEDYLRGLAKVVEYRTLYGVGHFLMMEKPAEFNAVLAEALGRHGLIAN
jgi:pimeloyl-ACP methyl ester carboxylesterase